MINLTQHSASAEQLAAGVIDMPGGLANSDLTEQLTFTTLPDSCDILHRAAVIAYMASASGESTAMIGGAMWLMAPLINALRYREIEPFFAFSARESVEQVQPDGSVRKTAIFRHKGFVAAI